MLTLALLSLAHATTWTVDPSGGADATTIAEGAALLSRGDTLSIAPGTYDVSGVVLSPSDVALEGAGWDRTVFEGSGALDEIGLRLSGENVMISGVRFQNYIGVDSLQGAVKVDKGVSIQSCAFIGNNIGLETTYGHRPVVAVTDTIFAENRTGIYISNLLDTLHVENALFVDNEEGVESTGSSDYVIFNLFEVVNSTFVGDYLAIYILGDGEADAGAAYTVNIVNNIFSDVEYSWEVGVGSLLSGEIRNNVSSPLTTSGADVDITESDNLEAEPLFVAWSDDGDWTNDDLHLMAGSPGIDAGVDGYATETTDLDGANRPIDGDGDGVALPDAGAYEYCPPGACADTGTDTGIDTGADTGIDTGVDTGISVDSGDSATSDTGDAEDSPEGGSDDTDGGHSVHPFWSCATPGGSSRGAGLILVLAALLGLRRRRA